MICVHAMFLFRSDLDLAILQTLKNLNKLKYSIRGMPIWNRVSMKSRIFKSLPSLVTIQSFVVCATGAELKSISKASTLLHRSQGAVSKQIRQLEEHYDVVLFERTTTGLELTKKRKTVSRYFGGII